MTNSPIQKILFGSPGTGKSHRVDKDIIPNDLGIKDENNIIKTVFHPEYTYGDFVGKLVPYTKASKVEYNFYAGHFLIALSQSYKNIINGVDGQIDNTVLVIDELNRGNSAAIFGVVFQLLDRNADGWSSYYINITELELMTILKLIGVEFKELAKNEYEYKFPNEPNWVKNLKTFQSRVDCLRMDIDNNRIYLPPNLSLLATMNTSDNSIYFMDSAFKRRWDWEFIEIEDNTQRTLLQNSQIVLDDDSKHHWCTFVDRLNEFIKSNYDKIRKIEDKQLGYRFINESVISEEKIKNKLMFFVWDSVFGNNKDPLIKLLFGNTNAESKRKLVTFGDFAKNTDLFIAKIMSNSF
jgi:5-methylcytosine-specific restriction protein B